MSYLGITLTDDGHLIIQRVKKEDEGVYECQARNAEGVVTSSAVITVHGKYTESAKLLPVLDPTLKLKHDCETKCLFLWFRKQSSTVHTEDIMTWGFK